MPTYAGNALNPRKLRLMVITNLPDAGRGIHVTQTALLADRLEEEGAQVLRATRETRFVLKTVDILRRMWLWRKRYDLVQIQTTPYHGFVNTALAILAGWVLRKPVISNYFTSAGPDFLEKHRVWAVPLLKRASAVVVASRYVRDRLAALGVKSVLIPHVLDTSSWTWKARSEFRPALIWVRRFHTECDPISAILAFKIVKSRHANASLTMVGEGPLLPDCKRLVLELGLQDVHFPGFVPQSALPALYRAADIFLHTSLVDNQPQSVLEAMACGLAVIASHVGGVPELLGNGRAGLLVSPRDPEGIANAIENAISSPVETQRLTLVAREKVLSLNWCHIRPLWLQLYRAVLEGNDGRQERDSRSRLRAIEARNR